MLHQSFLFGRCLHTVKKVRQQSSAGGRWAHSSAFRRVVVIRRVEVGGSLDIARTASTGVERTRPMMSLAASS